MQTGISLQALAAKIEGQKALKADYVTKASDLRMEVQDDGAVALTHKEVGSLPVLPLAHDQIGAKLGIPARYYDRMLASSPDLLADNVNHWLDNDGDRRMLRTMGGDLRAFLSDRYQRIENEEIATAALPALAEFPGIQVVSCEVTDRRMHIVATLPTVQGEVKLGDIVQAGIRISNSEVGLGACEVVPLCYRLVCLNGATINEARFRRAHVGRRVEEGEDMNVRYADDTRAADDKALLLKVRDTVRHALSEEVFTRYVNKMKGLTEAKLTGDLSKSVELLARKIGATEDERGGILRSLAEGGDLTAWGLLNAVTHQAHTAKSYDRSMDFVDAGGSLIDLPKSEWKTILEAA